MKTIFKLILLIASLNLGAQETEDATDFLTGVVVSNATEVTTAVKIPLLDTNLKMNTWITAANLLDGLVSGSGTVNYLAKFTSAGTVGDSQIFDNGNVGIGTNTPSAKLDVAGRISQTSTGESVFIGEGAGLVDDLTLNRNVFVGKFSGKVNTSGHSSVGTGYKSLFSNETGFFNTATGSYSMHNNVSGTNNVATGYRALYYNTDGSNNTVVGDSSLIDLTSGDNNTVLGANTALDILTGSENTIIGANVTGLSPTLFNHIIIADGDGNQRINVDETGNVGIGTTTPSTKVEISGDNTVPFGLALTSTGGALGGNFHSSSLEFGNTNDYAHSFNIRKRGIGTNSRLDFNTAGSLGTSSGSIKFSFYENGNFDIRDGIMSISDSSNPLIYFKDGANVLKGGIGFFSMSSGTLSLSVGSSGLGSDTKMAITPNGNIGIGTPTPNASAKLQLDSTSQGFLPPRMTQVQRDAIASPEEGLMIYQTDGTKGWYGYNGTAWVQL